MTTHEIPEDDVYMAVRAMFPDAEFTVENDDEPFLVIKTNLMFCGDTGEMLIGAVNPDAVSWARSIAPATTTSTYTVQYEVDYGEGFSDNGLQTVKAGSENEAMLIFNLYYADIVLYGMPRSKVSGIQSITANAAWLS